MALKKDSRGRKRNYDKEYKRDHAGEEDKKARARRGRDRAKKVADGTVSPGQDVHHSEPRARGKTKAVSRKWNRGEANKRRK